ncbi:hypothetical protein SERLA73DRAFT_77700 [Serpula lacrymans var. lacrymans S7.3]|uniref:Uncharacterized protein n=2 Tax=Serpula lacrymans var. lacrymans TaxID=341189 RepID=F8QBS2_SERL3|nr:uncharacterized protein SERLADRAFT_442598 [Serpula lacrymans var. lacrymans S7.9]EGN94283.1 hypothetical protein SERLA73DRAFT_77700 [Serpula lacrymans var. lacrymans S7.3]EGO19774.1 hypothetical protein SERLADRAFT_442598 [Serpula lacrymans var. lacrymans S7.9]
MSSSHWTQQFPDIETPDHLKAMLGKRKPTSSEDPEITWILKDEKAHEIIQDHISDALLMRTGDLTSSKELFDKLVSLHQTSNIALAFYSFQQLTKLSWDGISPIQDHIAKIWTIDSHLSGMKLGVDTKLMAFALLQSLPCTPEWQIFHRCHAPKLIGSMDRCQ